MITSSITMSEVAAPTRRIGTRAAVRLENSAMAELTETSTSDVSSSQTRAATSQPARVELKVEPIEEPMEKPREPMDEPREPMEEPREPMEPMEGPREPMEGPKEEPMEESHSEPVMTPTLVTVTVTPVTTSVPVSAPTSQNTFTALQVKDALALQSLGQGSFTGRKRKANFSNEETETLVKYVVKHFSALYGSEALRTESTRRNQRRSQLWHQIQKNVNDLGYTARSIDDLKHKWRDLRLEVKRKITHRKTVGKVTPPPGVTPIIDTKLSPLEEQVASTIGQHCSLDGEQEGLYIEPGVPRQSIFFNCRGSPGAPMPELGADKLDTAPPRPNSELSLVSPLLSSSPAHLSFLLSEDGDTEDNEMDTTPAETPAVTPSVTPSVTPAVTPSVTPAVTPLVTPAVTPSVTPAVTPSVTPVVTPTVTPSVTPVATPAVTPAITIKPVLKESWCTVKELCTLVASQTVLPPLLPVKQEVLLDTPILSPAHCESQGSVISARCESQSSVISSPESSASNITAPTECNGDVGKDNPAPAAVSTNNQMLKLKEEEEEEAETQDPLPESQDEWEGQSVSPPPSENAPEDSMPSTSSQDGDPDPSSSTELPTNGDCSCQVGGVGKDEVKAKMQRLLELEERWDRLYDRELGMWDEERQQQQQQRAQDRELQQQLLTVLTDIRDELRQLRQERAARHNQSVSSANASPAAPETPRPAKSLRRSPASSKRKGRQRPPKNSAEEVRSTRPAVGHSSNS